MAVITRLQDRTVPHLELMAGGERDIVAMEVLPQYPAGKNGEGDDQRFQQSFDSAFRFFPARITGEGKEDECNQPGIDDLFAVARQKVTREIILFQKYSERTTVKINQQKSSTR